MDRIVQPKVVLCILNWNGWQDTIECLESVQNLSYSNYQVVVLDNGSTDESVEKIKTWCQGSIQYVEYDICTAQQGDLHKGESELSNSASDRRLILLRSSENQGFAEGNNAVLRYILRNADSAEFFFLLNNDTKIDPECLSRAVIVSQENNASVVTCVVKEAGTGKLLFSGDHRPSKLFYVSYSWFKHQLQDDEPSNMAWGTAMMIRKDALLDLENRDGFVFDPRLFLYAEDNDLSMRVINMGRQIYLASKAYVYHKQTDSCVNKKFQNSFLLYYATRNTVLVARRHIKGIWRLLFSVYYPTVRLKDMLIKILRRQFREASNIFEGLWDGYRNISGKWRKHV
ncbi:glycosyltransferase family 2 protein [Acidobacteriota bacterium]